jgi:hypothetical protein
MIANLTADALAVLHIGYFIFIVWGTVAILLPQRPAYIRDIRFRLVHMLAVYIVLAEDYLHIPCILNVAQWTLRTAGGGPYEAATGVSGLLDGLLYRTIPGSVLNVMYVALGVALPILLWAVPATRRRSRIANSQPT